MASKKIDYRLKDVFGEAYRVAGVIRWHYIPFLAILLLLLFVAKQIIVSALGKPTTPHQIYLANWIILPIIFQFVAALYVAVISYTIAFKKFMLGRARAHSFFDYFTKIFAVLILAFYISNCLHLIINYPSVSRAIVTYHPAALLGLGLLSFVVSLVLNSFLIFSFLHVLLGEHGVRSALIASCRQVKPHWLRVFMLTLALSFSIMIPNILVILAFHYLNMPNAQTSQVIAGLDFGVLGIVLFIWLTPIFMAAFLISYRKLAMNVN